MKILVVVPTQSSLGFLKPFLERMIELGWSVHCAASGFNFNETDSALIERVEIHQIEFPRGANPISHFIASRQLRALVKKIQPSVIDVHFSAAMLTAALAKTNAWPATLATIQGLRFPTQRGFRQFVERKVECWSANRMLETCVLTNDDYQALVEAGVRTAALQKAKGFGCDLQRFSPTRISDSKKASAEAKVGYSPDDLVLIFVGRKTAFKGYHTTVLAFLCAVEENPNLKLVVCGNEDPIHSTGLSAEEEQQVTEHARIIDLGWTTDIENYLSFAYANIFPSEREGMPVNLMESMGMGVPVITLNSRGCRDIVTNDLDGVVIEDSSVRTLTTEILDLANDPERRARLANEAMKSRDQYDQIHFVNERIAKIQQVADERSS